MLLTEIIEELKSFGMSDAKACQFAEQLIGIGARSAICRPETLDGISEYYKRVSQVEQGTKH